MAKIVKKSFARRQKGFFFIGTLFSPFCPQPSCLCWLVFRETYNGDAPKKDILRGKGHLKAIGKPISGGVLAKRVGKSLLFTIIGEFLRVWLLTD